MSLDQLFEQLAVKASHSQGNVFVYAPVTINVGQQPPAAYAVVDVLLAARARPSTNDAWKKAETAAEVSEDEIPDFFIKGDELTWPALSQAAVDRGFSRQAAGGVWRFLRGEALAAFQQEHKLYSVTDTNGDGEEFVDLQALHNVVMEPDFNEWLSSTLNPRSKAYQLLCCLMGECDAR